MAITSSTVSDGATSSDSTIAMIFTSSEATSNFVVGDITVSGGALSSFSGSGTTYTATFTPSAQGATTIDVAGQFTDSSGNNNSAATQFNWTYDTSVPTMAITSSTVSDGATSNNSTLAMIFTSSEATTTLSLVTSALAAARSRALMLFFNGLTLPSLHRRVMAQRPLTLRVEPLPIVLEITIPQRVSLTGLMTLRSRLWQSPHQRSQTARPRMTQRLP